MTKLIVLGDDGKKYNVDISISPVEVTPPVDPPVDPPVPVGDWNISVWGMQWSNSPKVHFDTLETTFNEFRYAFHNGTSTTPRRVGDGPYGATATQTELRNLVKRGVRVSSSIGGGGYEVNVSDPAAFIRGLEAEERWLGIRWGGLNWDWESSKFKAAAPNCIEISRRLKAAREDFYVSWSPNGSYKDDYRNALRDAEDVVDEIAQQFYDSVVSYEDAEKEVKKYIAMFGADKVGVGMMIGSESKYWDINECLTYMGRFSELGVRKANLWEMGRAGRAQWAKGIHSIVTA